VVLLVKADLLARLARKDQLAQLAQQVLKGMKVSQEKLDLQGQRVLLVRPALKGILDQQVHRAMLALLVRRVI